MLISFLGTLPLGTLNVATMQLSVTDGIQAALLFSTGALLVEMGYVRLSLLAMNWVRKQKKLFRWLEWVTILVILALAVASFWAAGNPVQSKNPILSNTLPRFWLGVIMSAVNPVQIPFWFGWSNILHARNILQSRSRHYNTYMLGIGLGTFIGNGLFIAGGRILVDKLDQQQSLIQWIIGIIFALTAIIQLWKMLRGKDASRKLEEPADTETLQEAL
ncbi:MAG TPA: LysE family transporter [Chitinophagaceae bacterium]|nr:LysE family transporter [Chitinophagaceae bacterium]